MRDEFKGRETFERLQALGEVVCVGESPEVLAEAAERFGVGIKTAITWVRRWRETGSMAPGKMGGHRKKTLSGPWRDWMVARCSGEDFTLRGLVAELGGLGLKVDYRSVWEFVHAEGLSHKERR